MHNKIFQKDTHYELNPAPYHLIAMHPNARCDTSIILKISFFFFGAHQWPHTMLSAATLSLEHLSYSHNKSLWYQQHVVVTVIWHNLQPPFENKVTEVT